MFNCSSLAAAANNSWSSIDIPASFNILITKSALSSLGKPKLTLLEGSHTGFSFTIVYPQYAIPGLPVICSHVIPVVTWPVPVQTWILWVPSSKYTNSSKAAACHFDANKSCISSGSINLNVFLIPPSSANILPVLPPGNVVPPATTALFTTLTPVVSLNYLIITWTESPKALSSGPICICRFLNVTAFKS